MSARDLINVILDGGADDDIDAVYRALNVRQKVIRQRNAADLRAELNVGDTVLLGSNISPKYLAGERVTVKRISGNEVRVEIVDQWTRQRAAARFGSEIRVPFDLLEREEA